MANFYVGMRVRLVDGGGVDPECMRVIGAEARIFHRAISHDWLVICATGEHVYANECCMEPIIPTGHQPAELTVEELLPFLKAREVSDVAV